MNANTELKIMKLRLMSILLIFYAASVSAQYRLTGTIVDANRQHIPYVTVQLLNADSTFVSGCSTDSIGRFALQSKQQGRYMLSVSSVGYRSLWMSVDIEKDETQLSPIILQTDNILLDNVVVEASSFVRTDDKLLIHPDKKSVKHSHTGYDLLYSLMIPGVDVDRMNGTVSALGGEASMYIDGRKVDYREVQSLRPKDVDRIEYYDVPSGKYIGDVVSINFITKKYDKGGYVSLDAKQSCGYFNGDYNAVAKLVSGKTSYVFFAGHAMSRDRKKENISEHFIFPDSEIDRQQKTLKSLTENNKQYAQLNIANENERRMLVGKFSFVRNETPTDYGKNRLEYNGGESKESEKRSKQSGLMPNMELYGHFNLTDKRFLEFTLSGHYAHNDYYYDYKENTYSSSNGSKEDVYDMNALLIYGVKLPRKSSLSMKLAHRYVVSMASYEGTAPSWQHLWQRETIAFGEYKRHIGKNFSYALSPGLSFLQYRLHNQEYTKYFSPRLQSRLMYAFTKRQQLQFMFNIGNTNPQIQDLNNAELHVDSLQVIRGNSKQKVARFVTASMMYGAQLGKFNMQCVVNYQGGNGLLTKDYYLENDKLVQSNRSDAKAHITESTLSVAYRASDNWRLKVDGIHTFVKIYNSISECFNNFSGRIQSDFYWKSFMGSVYGKTELKEMDPKLIRLYTPSRYGCFVRWNQSGWYVEAGVENLFRHNDRRYRLNRDVYSYTKLEKSRAYQNVGYVKIAYSFDFGKKTQREKNAVNKTINSAILKAE